MRQTPIGGTEDEPFAGGPAVDGNVRFAVGVVITRGPKDLAKLKREGDAYRREFAQ